MNRIAVFFVVLCFLIIPLTFPNPSGAIEFPKTPEMKVFFDQLPPWALAIILFIIVLWAIAWFMLPFFVWRMHSNVRKIKALLKEDRDRERIASTL